MCQRVTCDQCGKPSYAGCGRHVEQVLGEVPKEKRCRCREQLRERATGEPGVMARLFGQTKSGR